MPQLFTKKEAHYSLMIWHIEEEESFFSSSLGFSTDKKHPKRRLEHLAGRFLLQQLDPNFPFEKMTISPEGKPVIENEHIWFSISHSYPYAAAIISNTKSVGIDIQTYVEKIIRIQHKFLSEAEQVFTQDNLEKVTIAWTAKEALFKYYGLGAVDFKLDMPIHDMLWYEHNAKISMILNKTMETCRLSGFTSKDFAVSWL